MGDAVAGASFVAEGVGCTGAEGVPITVRQASDEAANRTIAKITERLDLLAWPITNSSIRQSLDCTSQRAAISSIPLLSASVKRSWWKVPGGERHSSVKPKPFQRQTSTRAAGPSRPLA